MKRSDLLKYIPAPAGLAALLVRRNLYASAVDATGRIVSGHPMHWVLLALSLGVAALCLTAFREKKGDIALPTGARACVGCCSFAFGIAFTVLTARAPMSGPLGQAWTYLGILSAPCLVWAGICQAQGKTPPFFSYAFPAVFLTAHLINHYQLWCSNPQLQDVAFPLFATVALTVAAYQMTALPVGLASRRQLLAAGSLAVYLCLGELAVFSYPVLYLSGAIWADSLSR